MSGHVPEQQNVDQHTVTRFYLNEFSATVDKKVFVRKRGGSTYGPVSTEPLTTEDYAFTIFNEGVRDDSCDDVNSRIETRIAGGIKSLTPAREPSPKEWLAVLFLSANLLARSRRTRDAMKESIQWAGYIAEDAATVLPSEMMTAGADINRSADIFYQLVAAKGTEVLISALMTKKCDLLTIPAGAVFVTSDDPAVVYVDGHLGKLELRPGFIERQEVEVFMALKPTMAVHWHTASKCEVREVGQNEVLRRNQDVYQSCYSAAFSNCRNALDALIP